MKIKSELNKLQIVQEQKRKVYQIPKLTNLGCLATITQGAVSGVNDANGATTTGAKEEKLA